MAKQGSTRDRPNPRHCPSIKLVSLTGRRSLGFHQGQRSVYRREKAGYMTASSTAIQISFPLQHRGRPYMTMPVKGLFNKGVNIRRTGQRGSRMW